MSALVAIAKGQVYDVPEVRGHLYVTRVARDRAWADIRVVQEGGATWTKRQPLTPLEFFAFDATLLGYQTEDPWKFSATREVTP